VPKNTRAFLFRAAASRAIHHERSTTVPNAPKKKKEKGKKEIDRRSSMSDETSSAQKLHQVLINNPERERERGRGKKSEPIQCPRRRSIKLIPDFLDRNKINRLTLQSEIVGSFGSSSSIRIDNLAQALHAEHEIYDDA